MLRANFCPAMVQSQLIAPDRSPSLFLTCTAFWPHARCQLPASYNYAYRASALTSCMRGSSSSGCPAMDWSWPCKAQTYITHVESQATSSCWCPSAGSSRKNTTSCERWLTHNVLFSSSEPGTCARCGCRCPRPGSSWETNTSCERGSTPPMGRRQRRASLNHCTRSTCG